MKIKQLELALPGLGVQVAGHFKLVATKLDGSQRVVADWFPNLVTDVGLNQMGIGAFRNTCAVGTGSLAPSVTDTQLQTFRARTTTGAPAIPGPTAQPSAPYYSQTNTGFRFGVGAAAGNLTEVGVGWYTGSNPTDYQLWSRTLIKDEFGDPTSVTVLADEVLDVYYAMRIYPPTADSTYSISISGVTYNCTTRAANVTSTGYWSVPAGRVQFITIGTPYNVVYNGPIGLITGTPSGYSAGGYSCSNLPYSNNSLRQDATMSWGLDYGNVTGGIKSIFYFTSVGCYQTEFDNPIPKDNTKVLSVSFRVGWDRRP